MNFAAVFALASIIFSLLATIWTPAPAGAADVSARERLGVLSTVEVLYSIDDLHTYVEGDAYMLYEKDPDEFAEVHRFDGGEKSYFIVKHTTAQPLVYKSPRLSAYEDLAIDGGETITLASAVDEGYTGADLFQRAYASCRDSGGEMTYVVTRPHGRFKRLVEVPAVEGFTAIASDTGRSAWYMACNGPEKFVISKDYSVMSDGASVARIFPGRTLMGVNYLARGDAPTLVAGATPSAEEPINAFLERMAREVAVVKGEFVKARGEARYRGYYQDSDSADDCGEVKIERVEPPAEKAENKNDDTQEIYGFKVCRDTVRTLDIRAGLKSGLRISFLH